jgi:hypothetical protein
LRIADGMRRIDKLGEELRDGRAIAEPYAAAVASQARRYASRRPTPQAPMAGAALVVRGSSLAVPRGLGAAGAVAGGSEYGSNTFRQFGPRKGAPGHWLGAAAERPDSATLEAGDEALDELVERVV